MTTRNERRKLRKARAISAVPLSVMYTQSSLHRACVGNVTSKDTCLTIFEGRMIAAKERKLTNESKDRVQDRNRYKGGGAINTYEERKKSLERIQEERNIND